MAATAEPRCFERGSPVLDYWLERCSGFTVVDPTGRRLGTVKRLEPGPDGPTLVMGMRGRALPASEISAVWPQERFLVVAREQGEAEDHGAQPEYGWSRKREHVPTDRGVEERVTPVRRMATVRLGGRDTLISLAGWAGATLDRTRAHIVVLAHAIAAIARATPGQLRRARARVRARGARLMFRLAYALDPEASERAGADRAHAAVVSRIEDVLDRRPRGTSRPTEGEVEPSESPDTPAAEELRMERASDELGDTMPDCDPK
jgi:hypothetical protein